MGIQIDMNKNLVTQLKQYFRQVGQSASSHQLAVCLLPFLNVENWSSCFTCHEIKIIHFYVSVLICLASNSKCVLPHII